MRVLVVGEATTLPEAIEDAGMDVATMHTLDGATAKLGMYWPDVVVVAMDWTVEVAAWVGRNVARYGLWTIIIGRMLQPRARNVTYLHEAANEEDVLVALRVRNSRVA